MYLSFPAPDDEQYEEGLRAFCDMMNRDAAQHPEKYRLKKHPQKRRTVRRRGSDNPLKLTLRPAVQRTEAPKPLPKTEPKAAHPMLTAVQAAQCRGMKLESLAEGVGLSERTLRRRLRAPESFSLDEVRRMNEYLDEYRRNAS